MDSSLEVLNNESSAEGTIDFEAFKRIMRPVIDQGKEENKQNQWFQDGSIMLLNCSNQLFKNYFKHHIIK